MQQNKITVTLHDVYQDDNRNKLLQIGGMSQVPCLVIDGKALYESDDIIDWLKDNFKK
jgi:glutaredoxin 3